MSVTQINEPLSPEDQRIQSHMEKLRDDEIHFMIADVATGIVFTCTAILSATSLVMHINGNAQKVITLFIQANSLAMSFVCEISRTVLEEVKKSRSIQQRVIVTHYLKKNYLPDHDQEFAALSGKLGVDIDRVRGASSESVVTEEEAVRGSISSIAQKVYAKGKYLLLAHLPPILYTLFH